MGALDLFRHNAGPLSADRLAGGMLAAARASPPLLDLICGSVTEGAVAGDADHD